MSPRAWAAFAAMSTVWGIPYLFIKVAVDDGVPPAFLAWVRVTLGAAVLLALAHRAGALPSLRGKGRVLLAYARRGDHAALPAHRGGRAACGLLAGRDHHRLGPADRRAARDPLRPRRARDRPPPRRPAHRPGRRRRARGDRGGRALRRAARRRRDHARRRGLCRRADDPQAPHGRAGPARDHGRLAGDRRRAADARRADRAAELLAVARGARSRSWCSAWSAPRWPS